MATRKFWTDEEVGVIQSYSNWSNADLAAKLDRTERSVQVKRSRLKLGVGSAVYFIDWDEDEDEILRKLAATSTVAQIAEHLPGRNFSSVKWRLDQLGLRPGVHGKHKSPYTIGARPLIAKTCTKCGYLLPAGWFSFHTGKGVWNSVCRSCGSHASVASRVKTDERRKHYGDVTRASWSKMQSITSARASRGGYEWTSEDFNVLTDPDLTIFQKALRLGRTYAAVSNKAFKMGVRSAKGLGDAEADRWLIQNPNLDRLDEIAATAAPAAVGGPSEMW